MSHPSVDYQRGFYDGLDRLANFINSLDSGDMNGRQVRSAIYGKILELIPRTKAESENPVKTGSENGGNA